MNRLSEHDEAVLNSIFNPLLPLGEGINFSHEEELGLKNSQGEEDDENESDFRLSPEIVEIQKRAIYETEAKNFNEALKLFDEALTKSPNSPIILNDRAQCLRLAGMNEEAMRDLNLSIEISKSEGKIASRALCQRGILFRINGKLDDARYDFTEAAKKGSKFAKSQLVEINPYAAMCNQMLREMTTKLTNP